MAGRVQEQGGHVCDGCGMTNTPWAEFVSRSEPVLGEPLRSLFTAQPSRPITSGKRDTGSARPGCGGNPAQPPGLQPPLWSPPVRATRQSASPSPTSCPHLSGAAYMQQPPNVPAGVTRVALSGFVSGGRAQRPVLPLAPHAHCWVWALWAPGPFPGGRSPLPGTPPPGPRRQASPPGWDRPSATTSAHCPGGPLPVRGRGGEQRSTKGAEPCPLGTGALSVAMGRGWGGEVLDCQSESLDFS